MILPGKVVNRRGSQPARSCLVAKHGRCVLLGTPDEFCTGVFWAICTGGAHNGKRYPQFKHHHWTAEDLQHLTHIWAEQLRWKLETQRPDDDPTWLREKKGLWVRQDNTLMLPMSANSLWDGILPEMIPSLDGRPVKRE